MAWTVWLKAIKNTGNVVSYASVHITWNSTSSFLCPQPSPSVPSHPLSWSLYPLNSQRLYQWPIIRVSMAHLIIRRGNRGTVCVQTGHMPTFHHYHEHPHFSPSQAWKPWSQAHCSGSLRMAATRLNRLRQIRVPTKLRNLSILHRHYHNLPTAKSYSRAQL